MDKKGEAKARGMAVVRIPMSFIALLPHEKSIQGGICTKDGTVHLLIFNKLNVVIK